MSLETLTLIWFVLIFVLMTGYAVLDGFDLGVGILHLLARNESERRLHLNSIGPVWDGNEVWLLTGGGALFAAFPPVYATFSEAFYNAIMLLLAALIFRAVSLEFRSKVESPTWRRTFDLTFALGSLAATLLLGVALGNVMRGIPINADGHFTGSFLSLLNPYALLVGVGGVVLFALHGAAYLAVKTEGDLHQRMRRSIVPLWAVFLLLFVAVNVYTGFDAPHLFRAGLARPLVWVFVALVLAAAVYLPIASRRGKDLRAFLASSLVIAGAFAIVGLSLFPSFIRSSSDPAAWSLNAATHSSTRLTLTWMLGIAAIGVPLVLSYTAWTYWHFRGKTQLSDHHAY